MNVYMDGLFAHEDFVAIETLFEAFGDDFEWDASEEREPEAAFLWIDVAMCEHSSSWFAHTAFEIGQLSVRSPLLYVAHDTDLSQSPEFVDLLRRADARILRAPSVVPAIGEFCHALYATMPYRKYLQTYRWSQTRALARERAGDRCQLCNAGNRTLHTHHRTYERRGHELPEDLIVLCDACHAKFHDKLPKGGE